MSSSLQVPAPVQRDQPGVTGFGMQVIEDDF